MSYVKRSIPPSDEVLVRINWGTHGKEGKELRLNTVATTVPAVTVPVVVTPPAVTRPLNVPAPLAARVIVVPKVIPKDDVFPAVRTSSRSGVAAAGKFVSPEPSPMNACSGHQLEY